MEKPVEKKPAEKASGKSRGLPAALFLPKSKHDRRLANAAEALERARVRVRRDTAAATEVAEAARRALQDALDDEYLKTGVDPEGPGVRRADRRPEYVLASRPLERAFRDAVQARDEANEAAVEDPAVKAAIDRHRLVNLDWEVWVGEVCRLLDCRPADIDWKKGTYEPAPAVEGEPEVPDELLAVAD